MELLNNIIDDFNNFLSIDEIVDKYKEYNISNYVIKKIIKDNNLSRKKPSKFLKIFKSNIIIKEGMNNDIKDDLSEAKIKLYDERKIKNHLPKNINIDVVKTDDEYIDGNKTINDILNSTNKTLIKVRKNKR